jgi:hypothetical protein
VQAQPPGARNPETPGEGATKTTEAPAAPPWSALAIQRWGGADDSPGIDIPRDWRASLASLPDDVWLAWRRRTTQIQSSFRRALTAAEIREADRRAAAELGIPGADRPDPERRRAALEAIQAEPGDDQLEARDD